jgi:hypothetical protein
MPIKVNDKRCQSILDVLRPSVGCRLCQCCQSNPLGQTLALLKRIHYIGAVPLRQPVF